MERGNRGERGKKAKRGRGEEGEGGEGESGKVGRGLEVEEGDERRRAQERIEKMHNIFDTTVERKFHQPRCT